MRSTRNLLTLCLLAACALLPALPARAMTYMPVADTVLADHAPLIVEAEVLSREASPVPGALATDYLIQVHRVLKGTATGSHVLLRLPGGQGPDGQVLKVWGMPQLRPSTRAILLLAPREDGAYDLHAMGLGAFHRFEADGRFYALRDLSEAQAVDGDGKALEAGAANGESQVRDYERFAQWLKDRYTGFEREADYRVELSRAALDRLTEKFTLIEASGLNFRLFEFDAGATVQWRSNASGQSGLPGGGVSEFRGALGRWNRVTQTNINLQYLGTTGVSTSQDVADGLNVLLFDDPNGDVSGNCFSTGILATTLIRGFDDSFYQGRRWIRITEADIVTNNGGSVGCGFQRSAFFDQVVTHEVGHSLGLGHSCGDSQSPSCANPVLDDAVMRATVHPDGRDGTLRSDDVAGARALYRSSGGGGGGGGGGPAAPSALVLTLDKLDALLFWTDVSSDEEGFRVYRSRIGEPLALIAELPAGSDTYRDPGLEPETTYQYQVASVRGGREGRSIVVTVATPVRRPVSIVVEVLTATARPGEVVTFRAHVTGPAERVEWDFGQEGHLGLSPAPCAANTFCKSHIFTTPFSVVVTARVIGDLDQFATTSLPVVVTGPATPMVAADSFLQSAIFGPRGATGTFQSNVWLFNAGAGATLVEMSYLPRGVTGVEPERRFLTLEPGASAFLPNVLGNLFGATNTSGAIGLRYLSPEGAGAPDVRAISRSFVELGRRTDGTFGQFVGEDQAPPSTADKIVTGILEGDAFISTLLAANVGDTGGGVGIELFDAAGQKVGETSFGLSGRSMRFQRTRALFPEVVNHTGPFTARFFAQGGNAFVASATLLEARSEDQIFVPARELAQLDANPIYLPRVTRGEGQFGVSLTSQLLAYNPAATPTALSVELWLRGQENSQPLTRTATVPAGRMLVLDDVIRDLFGLEVATGALKVSWQNAEGVPPRLLSYAFADSGGAESQRFGMLVDSRGGGEAAASHAIDFGAEQSDVFRASYGAVNLATTGTTLELTLKDGEGRVIATKERSLRPQQHLELNLDGLFNDAPIGDGSNWFVETAVLRGGPVLTYLANINASGDIFFVPGRAVE